MTDRSDARRPFGPDEIARALESLPGWTLEGGALARSYRFGSFREAFGFMTMAALAAEKADHHPDWSNSYRDVRIRLSSHDVGAVTRRDVELARALEAIAASFPGARGGT